MAFFGGGYFAAHSVYDSAAFFRVLVARAGGDSTHVRSEKVS